MQNQSIKAGVIGGAGYTGGELVRILLNHPNVDIAFVNSKSNSGNYLHQIHHDLLGETSLKFSSEIDNDIDVLFLCAGHGAAKTFLENNSLSAKTKIIDLSQDFRLSSGSSFKERKFVYGLPELNKQKIKTANNIANPGCFATALQLGLLPLAEHGLLGDVYSVGITGSTGAGQGLSETSHFSWRSNNIQAYKSLQHQHINEIGESLQSLQQHAFSLNFVPWRGDFAKGIFITSQMKCDKSVEEIKAMFQNFYKDAPFVQISESAISMKQVVNTNKCVIQIEKVEDGLVVHSAIDNLIKGASGQAVQNMNLVFGFEETTGLKLKATGF